MICFAQGGYKSHSCCYYKGQTKGASDTSLWSLLCWLWRGGFPSDISSDFVLPFTASQGQKAKQTSLSFFWGALEDLQIITPNLLRTDVCRRCSEAGEFPHRLGRLRG